MSHYFENDPNLKSKELKVKIRIFDRIYNFVTDNGVFSKTGLDYGTRLLLKNVEVKEISGPVLDLGCGYGPIGIIVGSQINYPVDMVDINERALDLSKKNAKLNKVDNVTIFESNVYEQITKKYNYIITNPPIRTGKQMILNILLNAQEYLEADGTLLFVMRKDHGVKSIMKILEKEYQITILDRDKGFYIVKCTKVQKSA